MNRGNGFSPLTVSDFEFIHLDEKRDGSLVSATPDGEQEHRFIEHSNSIRDELRGLPCETENLNMARIQAFEQQINASTKPQLFLSPDNFRKALTVSFSPFYDASGIYFAGTALSAVVRNPILEDLNGPEITESFAVHEQAHSTRPDIATVILQRKRGLFGSRSYVVNPYVQKTYNATIAEQNDKSYGKFFEEGYAELERGNYVEEHGLIDQFTNVNSKERTFMQKSGISRKYFYTSYNAELKEQYLAFAPGVFAATIFDILIRHDSTIIQSLREGRWNDEGMKKSAESIDTLVPGLYRDMQAAGSNNTVMLQLLVEVSKELGRA